MLLPGIKYLKSPIISRKKHNRYFKMDIRRGEVFYADLSPVVGSEQGGTRPVLIVQNNVGNKHSPTVIADRKSVV